MKMLFVSLSLAVMAGCAVGSQDPIPSDGTQINSEAPPPFGPINHVCQPVLHGALCDQYQRVDPGDFTPGATVYQYSITCKLAQQHGCKPWSRDPTYYSEDSWVYCCEGDPLPEIK